MSVYKIQMPVWLYEKTGLKPMTFADKQKAIDALTEALGRAETKFTIKDEGNRTVFLQENGVQLAAVVTG
jgi:hypothetical protein